MKKKKLECMVAGICLCILAFFAVTVVTRFMTRQILIERLHIDNRFTRLVWFDDPVAGNVHNRAPVVDEIDWETQYPFYEENESQKNDEKESMLSVFEPSERVATAVKNVESKVETYTSDLLAFRSRIVESANAYERMIGWNFASYGEYNGIVKLSDDYLTEFVEQKDVTDQLQSLKDISQYCKDRNIAFLYVQAPYKISEYDDTDISGIQDFSNQNANELLAGLESAGVDYYDIRDTIYEESILNHSLFYRTDHHWKTNAGLWASQHILQFCNETYGWNADLSRLDEDQFRTVTYENWFLGSQGKKVTLARTQPDDFELLYPKYETEFSYRVPAVGLDTVGDYSIVYDMNSIDECDYYNKNPYGGCNYGDQPLIQIENQMDAENHKILIIHDSFGDCVISCLALAEKMVDSLDVRHFTGSVKRYIEDTQPDIVMVMYNAGGIGGEVDYSTHQDEFDLR